MTIRSQPAITRDPKLQSGAVVSTGTLEQSVAANRVVERVLETTA
jgi:hypothetical protein